MTSITRTAKNGIKIVAPTSIWKNEIKLPLTEAISGTVKAALSAATGNYVATGKSLIDVVSKGKLAISEGKKLGYWWLMRCWLG